MGEPIFLLTCPPFVSHYKYAMAITEDNNKIDPNADASITLALNDALKITLQSAWITWVYFGIAVAITYAFFAQIVPKNVVTIWAIATLVFQIVWLIINLALTITRPDAQTQQRDWEPLARIVTYVSNIIVISTIWLFLPYADERLRLIMIMFYLAMAPTQILARPNNNLGKMFGIIGILGSVAIFLAQRPEPYAPFMTIFILSFAIVMLLFANSTRRLVSQLVATRLESEEAKKKLEEALQMVAAERDAKTHFIAAASHDLGQPLQAASLFFDQTLRAPTESQRNKAADGVRKAFASADQLLSHMLNHLRLDADAIEPHFSQSSLGPFLSRLVAQHEPAARANGLRLIMVKTKLKVRTDRVLLERAFGNLINNAIRHSGGTRILVGVYRGIAGSVRLMVIDDGIGISALDESKIFDDYYRGTNTNNFSVGGFGLGLSSVRRIALLLDAKAGIDLRWTKGAAFYIELPLSEFVTNRVKEHQQ